jgi:hypothetical protein
MCDKKRRPAPKTAPPQPKGKSRSTPATMSRSVCGNEESLLRLIYRLTDHASQLRPSAITIAADSARKNDKICCQSEVPQGGGASPSSGVSVTIIANTPTNNSTIPSRTKTRGQPYIGRILHRLDTCGVLGLRRSRETVFGNWHFSLCFPSERKKLRLSVILEELTRASPDFWDAASYGPLAHP